MTNVTYLNLPMALLGRWRAEWDSDDGRSEYHIFVRDGRVAVEAIDYVDREAYVISNIVCDSKSVAFDTLMCSTGRKGHLVLEVKSASRVDLTFTFTDTCAAVRCED
ncbi:hypothetical protein JZX87_01760 [Agrobacterium sp. Ap1]|uniref:hypothetical protein n=1 Tax=Agrobacterium sp. Ap1 TaxID=2815337 RepID=UPI001A8C5BDC|nr:hypothetical protein [Agrobacterium sp. Ap1]MBO0139889.1 hypothetical protein [Agrobacterium sp. Ap1]